MYTLLYAGCSVEYTWRIAIAIGSLPAIVALVLRSRVRETPAFQITYERNHHSWRVLVRSAARVYGRQLLGTAGAWMLFDFTFYANGMFHACSLFLGRLVFFV